jgi:hypothetical protein
MDKVYVLVGETVFDYEEVNDVVKVFKTKEGALRKMAEILVDTKRIDKENGWMVVEDTETDYSAFKDGYQAQNHSEYRIKECVVEDWVRGVFYK